MPASGLARTLETRLLPAAVLVAIVLSIAFPATYYVLHRGTLEVEARNYANRIAEDLRDLALEHPHLWKYQTYKYAGIVRNITLIADVATVSVVDDEGALIADYSYAGDAATPWFAGLAPTGRADIVSNNRRLGAVLVRPSARDLARQTSLVIALAVTVGTALAIVLYRYPALIVRGMERRIRELVGALENSNTELTRLLADSRRQHEEAVALQDVAREITSSLDRAVVLHRVVERSRDLCRCDVAALFASDGDGETPVVAAAGAEIATLSAAHVDAGHGFVGHVLRTGTPFVTDACASDARLADPERLLCASERIIAMAAVPLVTRYHSPGFLLVARRTAQPFGPKDMGLLSRLADQAAIALENAQLYEERRLLGQQEERRRIAYELHDGIAQIVVTAKQHLDTYRALAGRTSGAAERELQAAVARIDMAIVETRRILRALKPPALVDKDLPQAIRDTLHDIAGASGWSVDFTAEFGSGRLPPGVETAAIRIAQEALTNIARHASARHVRVVLDQGGDLLRLQVEDDGIGFNYDAHAGEGIGLDSMRERAELLGGSCTVESRVGGGPRVTAVLPLANE